MESDLSDKARKVATSYGFGWGGGPDTGDLTAQYRKFLEGQGITGDKQKDMLRQFNTEAHQREQFAEDLVDKGSGDTSSEEKRDRMTARQMKYLQPAEDFLKEQEAKVKLDVTVHVTHDDTATQQQVDAATQKIGDAAGQVIQKQAKQASQKRQWDGTTDTWARPFTFREGRC